MKVLYVYAFADKHEHDCIEKEVSSWGSDITLIDFEHWLGTCKLSFAELDALYKLQHPKLIRFYNYIYRISKKYNTLVVEFSNPFHPEFLKSLKGRIYTVLHSGDDPQGSSNCSEQYVRYFDHAFAWGGIYDKNHTIVEKFKEWGAPRADRWVYGFREDMYNPNLTINDIYNNHRDIDVIIVTTPWKKEDCLAYIKSKIPTAQVYGKNYRGVMGSYILRTVKQGKIPSLGAIQLVFANEVKSEELVSLYQRSKIGINIHLSKIDDIHDFGCSGGNLRTTQLPANGVMQISGCKEGVKDIFEIDKEIVCFDCIEEAVELAKYYLNHDNERKRIAARGFMRAMEYYKCKTTFENAMRKTMR